VNIPAGLTEEEIKTAALNSEIGQRILKKKQIVKAFVVPARNLINFVVK
jgi:leucyl-tRNA synthetase